MEQPEGKNTNGTLFIGPGVSIEGKIATPGEVEIHGTVKGEIVANHIQIGEEGIVEGGLRATNVQINGFASRAIDVADTLTIGKTGRVEGDVIYGSIQIDAGATIFGNIRQRDQVKEPEISPATNSEAAEIVTADQSKKND